MGSQVIVRQDRDFGPGPRPAEPTGRIVSDPDEARLAMVTTRHGRASVGALHAE